MCQSVAKVLLILIPKAPRSPQGTFNSCLCTQNYSVLFLSLVETVDDDIDVDDDIVDIVDGDVDVGVRGTSPMSMPNTAQSTRY